MLFPQRFVFRYVLRSPQSLDLNETARCRKPKVRSIRGLLDLPIPLILHGENSGLVLPLNLVLIKIFRNTCLPRAPKTNLNPVFAFIPNFERVCWRPAVGGIVLTSSHGFGFVSLPVERISRATESTTGVEPIFFRIHGWLTVFPDLRSGSRRVLLAESRMSVSCPILSDFLHSDADIGFCVPAIGTKQAKGVKFSGA